MMSMEREGEKIIAVCIVSVFYLGKVVPRSRILVGKRSRVL
jgi:hypothetical protein